VPFLAFPTPVFGLAGEVTGAVNMLVDISERKRDEAAAQRLAAIVECSDDAIISKDLNGVIMSWNDGARRLFGYSEEEALGQSITILIPMDRQHEEPEILARLRRGERIDHFETVRQRKDGSLVEISLCISPIVTTSGKVVGASKIARDISERKTAERYRDTLFAEMKHRVRNTLALAVSISNQTFHQAPAEERATFNARLQALGSAHDILSKHAWERASLNDVVTRTLAPHRTGEGRIHIAGPEIVVDAAKAVALSLIIHELATNAAKYGALSGDSGSVWVEWALIDGEAVRFEWRERDGPAVREPERHGFGTRLIERGLAAEFKNIGLAFQPEGVTCALEFSRL
jgi:PAS domain S-box-containing protein